MKLTTSIQFSLIFCIACSAQATDQMSNLGIVKGDNNKRAGSIIDKKCISCHSKDKIVSALSAGKDMVAIQKEMDKRGAHLTSNEREVLGIFWKQSQQTPQK